MLARRILGPRGALRIAAAGRTPSSGSGMPSLRNGFWSMGARSLNPMDRRRLEEMRAAMRQGSVDDKKLLEYVRLMTSVEPRQTVEELGKGWESGKIPMDEPFVREYFKAAAAIGKLDSVNMTAMLSMLKARAEQGGAAADFASKFAMPSLMNSGGMQMSGGDSPNNPLWVKNPEPTWKEQAWKLARSAVLIFMVLSFTSAALEEFKGAAGGLGGRMGMGSVIHQAEHSDKSFGDVVGIDEAKAELEEIVLYLKDPKKFTRLGGKLPKGVLLTGPPGTGKTLLARAIAGEAGVPFFYSSGSEFEEMYVGVGARRVRELFDAAKGKSPCIIFIDEIDAIGGSRKEKDQSAMKMTLNQLLVEMDGFEQNTGVIVIAATNFPNSLDSALIRPGRFDKHVDVPMPDIGGRKAILDLYIRKIPTSADVNTEQIARGTPGFSGAELYNLVNQAAVKASVAGAKAVNMAAFEFAKDKLMMGAERRSAVISPETMKMTAFHEAGHALVALKTEGADPIHKATIMPRGRALGMVMQLPDGDQTSYSRKQMLARLDVCMGGRVAEELVYGSDNVTSGASSDIQQATRLARAMVTKYGLSDKVGVMFLDDKDKSSGDTQRDVDSEVRALLTDSYSRAKKVLTQYRRELDLIAGGLLRYESLSGEEVMELCNGLQPDVNGQRSQRPSRPISILSLNKSGGSGAAGGASGGAKGVDAAIAAATAATNVPPPTPSSGGFTSPPDKNKKGATPVSANKGAGQQPITAAQTTASASASPSASASASASSRHAPLAASPAPAAQPTVVTNSNTNTNTNKAPPLAPPAVSEPSSSQAAQVSQAAATAAPAAGKAGFFSSLFSSSSPSTTTTTTTTTKPQEAAAVSVSVSASASASASSAQTSSPVVVSTQQAPAKTQAQAQTQGQGQGQAQAQAQAQALSSKAAASTLGQGQGQGQGQALSAQKKQQPETVSAAPRGPPKP